MVTTTSRGAPLAWIVLVYRVPREPSTPRIAIWRRLRALGVAQLGDGTVALPEDVRTREHLEWIADRVIEAGGSALLLRAQTLTQRDEREMAQMMATARAQEYHELLAEVVSVGGEVASDTERSRAVTRLRKQLRVIQRRDYFPPRVRDEVAAAITDLARPSSDSPRVTTADGAPGRRR
ncbi:Chromate resistance protein ChrB [Janibacter indicus]|uniref:Chromate resistance protein ChrB n=1 Tax=Janibacter indicus TaxID=857417 RepID=UPI003D9A1D73